MGNGESMSDELDRSSMDSDERFDRKRMRDFGDESDDSDRCHKSYHDYEMEQKRKAQLTLRYGDKTSDCDSENEFQEAECTDDGISIEIKRCDWYIKDWDSSDIHKKKGTIRSEVFTAGIQNQLQFFFVMDKLKVDEDIFYGICVCMISDSVKSKATVKFHAWLAEYRDFTYNLQKKNSKFPRKTGYRFLGYIPKSDMVAKDEGENAWLERMAPDENVTIACEVSMEYKEMKPELRSEAHQQRLKDNKVRDVVLVVQGEEFPASKKVLKDRSSVFAKLLEKNAKAEKLTIDNVDPEVMRQLLNYMYTSRVTKLFALVDKLASAADRFKLKELKGMCQKAKTAC